MDPTLVKLARDVLLAQQKAQAAGVPLSQYDLDAYIKQESGNKYSLDHVRNLITKLDTSVNPRNLLRSAVQGATMDFGDELLGLLPKAIGGGKDAEEEMRLRQDLFRQQHPKVDAVAGMAGSLAPALLIPGGGEAALGKTMARGALAGGAFGAVSGAGRGEGTADRVSKAVTGGVAGAALGAALPGVVGGVKTLAPSRAAGRIVEDAMEQSGGANALHGAVDDMDMAGRGDLARVFDLSDPLRLVGDRAVNNSDRALAKIAPAVVERQRNAAGRILNDAAETLPEGRPNLPARARELKLDVRKYGNEMYEPLKAENKNIPLDPATLEAIQQPLVKDALNKAKVTSLIGPGAQTGPMQVGFAAIHETKKALDGAIGASVRAGDGYRMEKLIAARDLLLREMSKAPGADAVNATYAAKKAAQRALDAGAKAWQNEDVNAIADQMSQMTGDALDQFRYGIASKMYTKLSNAKTNRNTAKEMMDASDATMQKLRIVFGTEDNFERFLARVGQEAKLAKAGGMFGNSATHRRAMAAGFDPIERVAGLASEGLPTSHGVIGSIISKGADARKRAIANHLGDIVGQGGSPEALRDFINTFSNPEPLLGRLTGTALPAVAPGLRNFFQ